MENWTVTREGKAHDPLIASNMHVSELVWCVVNCLYCFSNSRVHITAHLHITDAKAQSNKAGRKDRKSQTGWEEKKQGNCTKSKNLIFIDSMQRQSPWQHSSPVLSSFHSPPPLTLLADKVYRQPPTPSHYDMFSVMGCWQAGPTASLPQAGLLSDAAFNIQLLYFQLPGSVPFIKASSKSKSSLKGYDEVWLGDQLWVCVCVCFYIVCVDEDAGVHVCVCVGGAGKEWKGCQKERVWRGSYLHLTAADWGAVSSRLPLKIKSIGVKSNEGN